MTQGIALRRLALGWVLTAFQAEFFSRPNGSPEPSPGLSEAMPWDTRTPHVSALKGRERPASCSNTPFQQPEGHATRPH